MKVIQRVEVKQDRRTGRRRFHHVFSDAPGIHNDQERLRAAVNPQ